MPVTVVIINLGRSSLSQLKAGNGTVILCTIYNIQGHINVLTIIMWEPSRFMQHFCETLKSNFSASLEGSILKRICGVMPHWEAVICADMLCSSVTQHDTASHTIHTWFWYSFVFLSQGNYVMVFFKWRIVIFPESGLPSSAGSVKELDVLTHMLILCMSVTVQVLSKTKGTKRTLQCIKQV